MFGLGTHGPDGRYGLVVDIGSTSVGLAIVASEPGLDLPVQVWAHREHAPLQGKDDLSVSERHLKTAILNAFLEFSQHGLATLAQHDRAGRVTHVMTAIAAPWSYTLSKTVTLKHEEPFDLTPAIVRQLSEKATKHAKDVLRHDEIAARLQLRTISDEIISITANDYTIHVQEALAISKVTVTMLTGLAREGIVAAIEEAIDKVVPKAAVSINTFMALFYQAVRDHLPNLQEVCLLDVTNEATELGVVRSGVLRHTSHIPYGYHTLARHLEKASNLSHEEARGLMRDVETEYGIITPEKTALSNVEQIYESNLTGLFTRTGDDLSIPKTIFLHTDLRTEGYFAARAKSAAHQSTGLRYAVRPITSQLFGGSEDADTALLLSSYVFHKRLYETSYLHQS